MTTRYAKPMVIDLISSKLKKVKVLGQVLLLRMKEGMMLTCLMFPH